jgi:hypothetical protein
MICYMDMTFCSSTDCGNKDCPRNWELLDKTDYNRWSETFDDNEGPVAFADFKEGCDKWIPMG